MCTGSEVIRYITGGRWLYPDSAAEAEDRMRMAYRLMMEHGPDYEVCVPRAAPTERIDMDKGGNNFQVTLPLSTVLKLRCRAYEILYRREQNAARQESR